MHSIDNTAIIIVTLIRATDINEQKLLFHVGYLIDHDKRHMLMWEGTSEAVFFKDK